MTKTRGALAGSPVGWEELVDYIRRTCQELPYSISLGHITSSGVVTDCIAALPISVSLPPEYVDAVYKIPLRDRKGLIEGEMAIVPYRAMRQIHQQMIETIRIGVTDRKRDQRSWLLRGGFAVGRVPGLPDSWRSPEPYISARMVFWQSSRELRYLQTNLSRAAPSDEAQVGEVVFQTWFRFLLEHRAELPEGFLYGLGMPRRLHPFHYDSPAREQGLASATWLEEYDALSLYELARNGWQFQSYDDKNAVDIIDEWEQGKTWARISSANLHDNILNLVLPRIVTERRFEYFGDLYVGPPMQNWREILGSWKTFVSEPVRWRPFVTFVGRMEDHLCHMWGGHDELFNAKYAGELSNFTDEELAMLASVFHTLLSDRSSSKLTALSQGRLALLHRALSFWGDLKISSAFGTCSLSEFDTRTLGAQADS